MHSSLGNKSETLSQKKKRKKERGREGRREGGEEEEEEEERLQVVVTGNGVEKKWVTILTLFITSFSTLCS